MLNVIIHENNYCVFNSHSNLIAMVKDGIIRYKSGYSKKELLELMNSYDVIITEWIKVKEFNLSVNSTIQALTGLQSIALEQQTCKQYGFDLSQLGLRVTDQIVRTIAISAQLTDQARIDREKLEQRKKESYAQKCKQSRIARREAKQVIVNNCNYR